MSYKRVSWLDFLNGGGIGMLLLFGFIAAQPIFSLPHQVIRSDTLFGLAKQYDIPVSWILRANNLKSEMIFQGQVLEIPTENNWKLVVQPGDTLSGIGWELGLDPDLIKSYNNLESDNLRIGRKLKLPAPTPEGSYIIRRGDTLIGIARRNGMNLDDLKNWNNLKSDKIYPGQTLALYPGSNIGADADKNAGETVLAASEIVKPTIPKSSIPQHGEYFFSAPDQTRQPSKVYWESPTASSAVDFRRAQQIITSFDKEIAAIPKESRLLNGWHVVIDPGHGGLDPGAIVSVPDGNGNLLVITEDEYAYDIALRLYRALILNGASTSLTILAPDHHLRNGETARQTFVHRKNEVYNHKTHNEGPAWRPVGTADGLDMRKTIAAVQIANTPAVNKQNGSIFVSIHADNSPDFPAGTAVLFDGTDDTKTNAAEELATTMVPLLGAGAFTRQQSLRVLQDNPADAAVLVEARNIHYPRNAWALRSSELREQDAQMIAAGIIAWAATH